MSIIGRAIDEGIRLGIEDAAVRNCDGRDDPEERCPYPCDECVCAWVYYRDLPWWKKIFREAPPRPSQDEALSKAYANAIVAKWSRT